MSQIKPQSYDRHKKFAHLYHFMLTPLTLILFIASIVYLIREDFSYSSLLIFGLSCCVVILVVLVRLFATQLQDRLIRQEENFRHVQLTGKPLDSRLSLQQIIALRFADDESFPRLCEEAAKTGMEPQKIKQAIPHWRADNHRV
jgi:hypothetical protein